MIDYSSFSEDKIWKNNNRYQKLIETRVGRLICFIFPTVTFQGVYENPVSSIYEVYRSGWFSNYGVMLYEFNAL